MRDVPVYLDHNATTPLDPRVAEAMLPWLGGRHGNPSSVHSFGRAARAAVDLAREQVADLIGAAAPEVAFMGSGTEANNAVLMSVFDDSTGGHLVISELEHPSIQRAADRLENSGVEVTRLRPGADGVVDAGAVADALRPGTRLACLMLANNELGTLQPVAGAADACRERGVPLLCDAVQAAGKHPVDVNSLGTDYLVVAAHKFNGPVGAAALWVREGAGFEPLILGGGQERQRRAGTENVAALVGFGACAALASSELDHRIDRLSRLRDGLETGLAGIPDSRLHCASSPRLPHTTHVAFPGLVGEELVVRLDLAGFAVSTGAACASGVVEPSRTLLAMGVSPEEAIASVRISLGTSNDEAEIDRFLPVLGREVEALRALSAEPVAAR
ncbi:MAG: cysteine desulfurase family protein [Acidobacteria bacterium]|nr:cysteine desulfurase family protein [Acidobacteriota bacterium]MXZ38763.1 cysteine desulfurase [Holophagales bacterium]MYJ24775.1 cysteine desulfurase [Holophagales bacterium]